ncbi:MAG: T9SS type A sorting domain-containing protein [Candidatus Zixiibacteriota bacterium]|nr:MAG: T9SS type A sorting domain-containing protein [candidate division Zixibacteria bacterium]
MVRAKLIIGAVLILLCLALSTSAQDIEFVSSTLHHNLYRGIGRIGDFVYCGGPYGIHIFDIGDPSNPFLAGIYDSIYVSRFFIEGNFAYAFGSPPGLWIFDVSDPLDPQVISSSSFPLEYPGQVAYYNNTFYSAIESDSLGFPIGIIYVVDVSDPYSPVVSDSMRYSYLVGSMWAADGYLQVHLYEYGFWDNSWAVYSLSDPAHPYYLTGMGFGLSFIFGLTACDHYAYLCFDQVVNIYDFSTPYDPTLVRIDSTGSFPNLVMTVDSIGYAWTNYGIRTYDMSNPVFPVQMGYAYISDNVCFFAYHGDTCFTTTINSVLDDDEAKFNIIDFTDLYNPSVIGEYWSPGTSYDVQLRGNYAFIANGTNGIVILDISIPEQPMIWDIFEVPVVALDLYIDGNRLYLLSNRSRFSIYEISEDNHLFLLGYINNYSAVTRNFYVDGDYAYLTEDERINPGGDFVGVLDISDPTNPIVVDTIGNVVNPNYIVVDNGYAYLTTSNDLRIYNVSNLDSISLVSIYPYQNYGSQIVIEYPYLYMACANTAFEIINISDPANPFCVGTYDSLSSSNITLYENYAILKYGSRLYIMDISDPENPELISLYIMPPVWYSTEEVYVRGQYIYVPAYSRFEILRLTPTGIEEVSSLNLGGFSLPQNYPNPFNASTTISYSLPEPADIRIEIFDILGRKVETLFSGLQEAGEHTVSWRPGDISSGIYYYRIGSEDFGQSRSCLLIK